MTKVGTTPSSEDGVVFFGWYPTKFKHELATRFCIIITIDQKTHSQIFCIYDRFGKNKQLTQSKEACA